MLFVWIYERNNSLLKKSIFVFRTHKKKQERNKIKQSPVRNDTKLPHIKTVILNLFQNLPL
jgi:hypothetical protein